jgi:hypothetical protein
MSEKQIKADTTVENGWLQAGELFFKVEKLDGIYGPVYQDMDQVYEVTLQVNGNLYDFAFGELADAEAFVGSVFAAIKMERIRRSR